MMHARASDRCTKVTEGVRGEIFGDVSENMIETYKNLREDVILTRGPQHGGEWSKYIDSFRRGMSDLFFLM